MSTDAPIIYLEEAWNDTIKKKALDPLEAMLEAGVKEDKKLFDNKEYITIYRYVANDTYFAARGPFFPPLNVRKAIINPSPDSKF